MITFNAFCLLVQATSAEAVPPTSWVFTLNPTPLKVGTTIIVSAIKRSLATQLHEERRLPVK